MTHNLKNLGAVLVGFSLILLFVLTFVKINSDEQGALLCDAFQENQLDMSECPAHKSSNSWTILLAFGIGFVMLGIGVYMLFMPKSAVLDTKKEFQQVDMSKLDEDEKRIYGLVKEKNGSAYQSDIIKDTGFSKVKITRILDKMETSGILERKRRGMTNIIVLK